MDYSKLNKDQLQHQTKLANIHLQIKNDSHTKKSALNIPQIVKERANESNSELKITLNNENNVDQQVTSIIQIRTRYSRPANTNIPPLVIINKHLDSCFIHALGVEVTDERWKNLI